MLSCWGFFLERVVSEEGISTDPDKVTPKSSILSISSFSVCLLPYGKRLSDCLIGTALPGLCSYYRKYVKKTLQS
jgi:hypothetical protein